MATVSDKKTVLIVYAHHCDTSFNAALKNTAVKTLEGQGCDVMVSDLYALKFDPLIGKKDVKSEGVQSEDGHFNYLTGMEQALADNTVVDDIVTEQEKLKKADLVIFQFPMQWFSMPAIMKGWIDRVFAPGVAYRFSDFKLYENGLLAGKKALLSFTTGSPTQFYSPQAVHGDMDVILYPIQRGALQFCGFTVLKPHICGSMVYVDAEARKNYLNNWEKRLVNIWDEDSCVPSIPMSEFDFTAGAVLKEDSPYREKDTAPYVGTHLGKPIKHA